MATPPPHTTGIDGPAYINTLENIDEEKMEVEPEGYYQELTDLKVSLPDKFGELNANDADDYHDSVDFADLTAHRSRPVTPHMIDPIPPPKRYNTKHLLLIVSGIILFIIMIVIIGILASHLVTDNDKQEKRLMALERKLSREERNNVARDNTISRILKQFNYSDAAKIEEIRKTQDDIKRKFGNLTDEVKQTQDDLKKLENVLSEIHCGLCTRQPSARVQRGYYCDCQNLTARRDCFDFYQHNFRVNGVYKIHQDHRKVISVYCDQSTDGGGWTVFQRRRDGSVNFDVPWADYVRGFGHLENEHWLGNQNIFTLTHQGGGNNELRIELEDWDGLTKYAIYNSFTLKEEDQNFRLDIGTYRGTAGESLTYSNEMPFSTKDKDNDVHDHTACAAYHKGGWWYKMCTKTNLNGKYYIGPQTNADDGIIWKGFNGSPRYSLKRSEMKVRRIVVS